MSWVEGVGEGGRADAHGLHVGERRGAACPSGGSGEWGEPEQVGQGGWQSCRPSCAPKGPLAGLG
jgi:hypothetical protein